MSTTYCRFLGIGLLILSWDLFFPRDQGMASGEGKKAFPGQDKAVLAPITRIGPSAFNHPSVGQPVGAVAISANGSALATAGGDGIVRLWSAGGAVRWTFELNRTMVTLAFSPDGKTLALGGGYSVLLWRVDNGRQLLKLKGAAGGVTRVGFSADGRSLFLVSTSGEVILWEFPSGKELLRYHALKPRESFLSVAYCPESKLLAGTCRDQTVRLYDVARKVEKRRLEGFPFPAGGGNQENPLDFSPDGKLLGVACTETGQEGPWGLFLLDVDQGRKLDFLPHFPRVLAFTPDGKRLVTANRDARVWDVGKRELLRTIRFDDNSWQVSLTGAGISGDGKILALALGQQVQFWDLDKGRELIGAPLQTPVHQLCFFDDGKTLATTTDEYKAVHLWDFRTGKELRRLEKKSDDGQQPYYDVAVAPRGKMYASAGPPLELRLCELATGRELRVFEKEGAPWRRFSFSPDGKILVGPRTGYLIETETGKELANLYKKLPRLERITNYVFSPNGKRLAIVCQFQNKFPEGMIRLWDIYDGKEVRTFQGPQPDPKSQAPNPYPGSLAFSPDGKMLAAAWNDKEIRCWEVDSGRQLPNIAVDETTRELRILFSPDGKHLVWASSRSLARKTDKVIHFWDLRRGREAFDLAAPEGGTTLLAFSRDGRYFAACGLDNTVSVWDLGRLREGK